MKGVVGTWGLFLFIIANVSAQVDTSYVYNRSTPYGTLDIRIRKSASRFYYLQENKTVSFRQNGSQKTNSYFDMTTWDSSPYTQGNMREKNGTQDYFIMNYRLLFPVAYKPSYSEGYPIIVMMHGAGERGNCWTNTCYHADRSWRPHTNNPAASTDANSKLLNNDHNLLHGGKPHLDARNLAGSRLPNDASIPGRSFPGFVLFPQNMNGWDANAAQDAIKLVRLIAKKYNVDEDRIYIHGLSNGGGAVYQAIKRAPWLFAAALTMSAADDGGIHGKNLAPTVAHIPMWIFQGGQDKNPTVSKTEGYLKKFRDAGAVVRYNLYPELGHGTWNTAYKEPDFFKWILSQNKANIHTFAGGRAICGTTKQGVRMELAKGFRKYQWQKNGVTISGATGPTYVATSTGTYRARFSRVANPGSGDWNDWSDPVNVTLVTPPRPKVDQIGTLMLKDLNGYGNARLVTTTDAAHYYWYKNGSLVNLSGNRDDTTRNPIFYQGNCTAACTGNGKYTLVTMTADKCPSPASTAKYVVFNNQAPTNITAPTGFTGKTSSMTSASFNWNDVSTNEIGFEVWRRKAGAKWEMRKITTPNVRSFTDTGLDPSSTYHYKIRAVNNNGKSNYTPAASNAYVIIKTGEDNTNPSVPQTLTAKAIAINTIQLSWKASTDNTGLKQYKIYNGSTVINTNSKNTTYTLSNLTLNKVYNFTVRAEDLGGNLSGNSNSATANTYVSGLYYEHSTGAWNDLDNINWSSLPEFEGHVKNFTLAPRTQEDFFNFEFDGYVYINKAGSYKFRTNSSDGSRLTLDNTVIVNNDGIHGNRTITSAARTLSAGPHKINLKYFEYDGTQTLIVQYYGPDTGNKWITIPNAAMKSGNPPSTTTNMTSSEDAIVMNEAQPDMRVSTFPNPTQQSNINVMIESEKQKTVQIMMMDFSGRTVYNQTFGTDELAAGMQVIPSEQLRRGMYLMIINDGENSIKQRISIQD